MTSLNPVMKIGRQITEGLRYHLEHARRTKPTSRPCSSSTRSASPTRSAASTSTRTSSRAACASGSRSPSPSPAARSCCSPTSPPRRSTSPCRPRSSTCSTSSSRSGYMAMVLVTHDLGVVAGRTDEIAVMYAGQIVEKAPTRTLFANVRMPYTEALLKSIPKLEDPSHTRLQIIGGRPPDLINPPPGCRFAPRCPYAQPQVPHRAAAAGRGGDPRPRLPLLVPRRHRRRPRGARAEPRPPRPGRRGRRHRRLGRGRPRRGRRARRQRRRRPGLMAGTGTAHLRDPDDVLLRIEDLVVEFKTARRHRPRRVRHQPRRPRGRDARARRRVRLRQVHDRPRHHAAPAAHRAARCCSRAPTWRR